MTTVVSPFTLRGASLSYRARRTLRLAAFALLLTIPLPVLDLSRASATAIHQPIYSVAILDAGLARHPAPWMGRTMYVRAGLAQVCTASAGTYPATSCVSEQLVLTDPDPASTAAPLPLAWDPTPGDWPRQSLHVGGPAVYHIQLRRAPCVQVPAPSCYGAVLLGAVPPFPGAYWM